MLGYTLLILSQFCLAANVEVKGISFSEDLQEAGQTLHLNGVSKGSFLFWDVDVTGLYLMEKSQNGPEVLDSKTTKLIRSHYFQNVDAPDVRKVWKLALEKSCAPKCTEFTEAIEKLVAAINEIKKGSEEIFVFSENQVEYRSMGKSTKIESLGFPKIVLKTWIGDAQKNEAIRSALLGKKQ